jgi:hypothetical protein
VCVVGFRNYEFPQVGKSVAPRRVFFLFFCFLGCLFPLLLRVVFFGNSGFVVGEVSRPALWTENKKPS